MPRGSAFETYYRELKDDVEVDEGGRLGTVVEKALETRGGDGY
jgi:hypothetical protein